MKTVLVNIYLIFFIAIACKPKENPSITTLKTSLLSQSINYSEKENSTILVLEKNGTGKISYSLSSNKSWVKFKKNSGNVESKDSILVSIDQNNSELINGSNDALIIITPTINGQLKAEINITLNLNFSKTTISLNEKNVDLGKISSPTINQIPIKKIGTQDLNYSVSTDKNFISFANSNGILTNTTQISYQIDTDQLENGKYQAIITIYLIATLERFNYTVNFEVAKPIIILQQEIADHTLETNEIWSGKIHLNGSVKIPKGLTLSILPGTIIEIARTEEGIDIVVEGKIIMNGNASKIIEIRADQKNTELDHWNGIDLAGEISASYCLIKNAVIAIDFFYLSAINPQNQTKAFNLNHILFLNNLTCLKQLPNLFAETYSNLSFINNGIFCVDFNSNSNASIIDSEFNNPLAIDIELFTQSCSLEIINSNFSAKASPTAFHLMVGTEIDNKNNQISARGVYGLNSNSGFGKQNNILQNNNPKTQIIQNIGCGFTPLFSSELNPISHANINKYK